MNPHDPYDYNEWYWRHQANMALNDANLGNYSYLTTPHIGGRFYSQEDMYDEPEWSPYLTYWTFRAHIVNIQDAINRLCDQCKEVWSTFGTRWEPPDSGCGHDWEANSQCPMFGYARFICHMLGVDPDYYPNQEW